MSLSEKEYKSLLRKINQQADTKFLPKKERKMHTHIREEKEEEEKEEERGGRGAPGALNPPPPYMTQQSFVCESGVNLNRDTSKPLVNDGTPSF